MKRYFLFGLLPFLFWGCFTTAETDVRKTEIQAIEKELEYKVYENITEHLDGSYSEKTLCFFRDENYTYEIVAVKTENGYSYYTLIIEYDGEDWEFLSGVVILSVNNEIKRLPSFSGVQREVISGDHVFELFLCEIDTETMERIANASTLKMEVDGKITDLTGTGLDFLKRFYAETKDWQ